MLIQLIRIICSYAYRDPHPPIILDILNNRCTEFLATYKNNKLFWIFTILFSFKGSPKNISFFASFRCKSLKMKLTSKVGALKEKKLFTKANFFLHMLQTIPSIFGKKNVLNERRGRKPACTSSCETYQHKDPKFREE